ncbi:MAG: LPS export ABC transporter permease LptF [Pseudomonadota bacterium]
MIIFRYLLKEITLSILATTTLLVMIFMCTQFVHYLSDAAIGRFAAKILLHLMMLQLPYLLGLLLPIGFFLAILLAYGRLYTDREMIVLSSCGISQEQLLSMTMKMAVVVMLIVGVFSMWISPRVMLAQKNLFAQAKSAPLIETMFPGRFFSLHGGKQVFYLGSMSRDRQHFQNIFIAQLDKVKSKQPQWDIVTAKRGYEFYDPDSGNSEMVIEDGVRYKGMPGQLQFQQQKFSRVNYGITKQNIVIAKKPETMTMSQLWRERDRNKDAMAELQWRISLPISVLLLAFFAVPMSYVNPRQGRYAAILPSVLFYIFYANMSFVSRDWIASGQLSPYIGLWWLHGFLFLVALTVYLWRGGYLKRYKMRRAQA